MTKDDRSDGRGDFATAGQISAEMMGQVAGQGFRAVICFRPDGEGGPEQPDFASIQAAATEHGLPSVHIPVVPGAATPEQIAETRQALGRLPTPILGYCASGARAQMMYKAAKS